MLTKTTRRLVPDESNVELRLQVVRLLAADQIRSAALDGWRIAKETKDLAALIEIIRVLSLLEQPTRAANDGCTSSSCRLLLSRLSPDDKPEILLAAEAAISGLLRQLPTSEREYVEAALLGKLIRAAGPAREESAVDSLLERAADRHLAALPERAANPAAYLSSKEAAVLAEWCARQIAQPIRPGKNRFFQPLVSLVPRLTQADTEGVLTKLAPTMRGSQSVQEVLAIARALHGARGKLKPDDSRKHAQSLAESVKRLGARSLDGRALHDLSLAAAILASLAAPENVRSAVAAILKGVEHRGQFTSDVADLNDLALAVRGLSRLLPEETRQAADELGDRVYQMLHRQTNHELQQQFLRVLDMLREEMGPTMVDRLIANAVARVQEESDPNRLAALARMVTLLCPRFERPENQDKALILTMALLRISGRASSTEQRQRLLDSLTPLVKGLDPRLVSRCWKECVERSRDVTDQQHLVLLCRIALSVAPQRQEGDMDDQLVLLCRRLAQASWTGRKDRELPAVFAGLIQRLTVKGLMVLLQSPECAGKLLQEAMLKEASSRFKRRFTDVWGLASHDAVAETLRGGLLPSTR
jgi:hypothetical protein